MSSAVQLPLGFMLPESTWSLPSELPDLRGRGVIAVDTETCDQGLMRDQGSGWPYRMGHICGVSMAAPGAPSVYAPIRHPDTDCLDAARVERWVRAHVESSDLKVFHSAHYDLGWLWAEWGIRVDSGVADVRAAAVLLEEERDSYSLDSLCRSAGIEGKDEQILVETARAHGLDPKRDMWRLPARYVGPYAQQDAAATLQLWQWQQGRIAAQGMEHALQVECDLIPMVVEMRRRGIRVDLAGAERAARELDAKRDGILAEISRRVSIGRALVIHDMDSPTILERLFDDQQVPYPRTPKTNRGSFSREWMTDHEHWLPSMVQEARNIHAMSNKFIRSYIVDYSHMGRVHAEIRQYRSDDGGTRTNRFSYADPPLQQIPKRDKIVAPLVRGVFLPEEGEVWCAADYSQQEYRLIVHFAELCGLPGARAAGDRYRQDPLTDFHTMVAEMTGLDRKRAKDANFAKSFGAGIPKFARMTGRTEEEAREIMERYDQELPFNSELGRHCQRVARDRGWVRLIDGARAHFDLWEPTDWEVRAGWRAVDHEEALRRVRDPSHRWHGQRLERFDTRKAMNRLIQGSAARQTKAAMRACWREGLCPLLQVHDELDFSVATEEQARHAQRLMEEVIPLTVPVVVEPTFGRTWGEACWSEGRERWDALSGR